MTAEALAAVIGARRSARGRWMARCPAHEDRSPSLSITEGHDGRVLLHCWAGCHTIDVLNALGFDWSALFAGPPPSSAEMAKARREHERADAERQQKRGTEHLIADRVMRLRRVVDSLGAKLARMPDGAMGADAMARLFHRACHLLHEAEAAQTESPAAHGAGKDFT